MKYLVEFFGNVMEVLERKGKDEIADVNFVTGRVRFRLAEANIIGEYGLNMFLCDSRGSFRRLKKKAKRCKLGNQRHGVTWKYGGLEFKFHRGADVQRVIKQFEKLLREIAPLLELGEIIFKQLERRPLNASTSMKLYMPMPIIDGTPVKQWLLSRERAALDIDPATAEIAWSTEQLFDPYGIYPEVPASIRHYWFRECFVRSPGSNVWVWFEELPKATQEALNKRIEA